MTKDWDEFASTWDESELSQLYADRAYSSLTENLGRDREQWKYFRALDFGCGTGLLTERLAAKVGDLFAVDTSEKMIEALVRKDIDNVTATCVDIDDQKQREAFPWFSSFDLIVASSVCAFLPNYEATLGLLASSLKPGGVFVQWDWLLSEDDTYGFTLDRVNKAFADLRLNCDFLGEAFAMDIDGKNCPVLMGVATSA